MLKIPTEQSEVVYQRTDKTIDDRKKQTKYKQWSRKHYTENSTRTENRGWNNVLQKGKVVDKALHRKLKIEQHDPH